MEDYFTENEEHRHFITVGYGGGRTQWFSRTEGYDLYDERGKKVLSGDHELSAVTDHRSYQIGVTFPVKSFRLGMGIEFDEFSLYRIHVEDPSVVEPVSMIDQFRFDKVHLTAEFPTRCFEESEFFEFDIFLKGGYYAFSKVNSFSLFGRSRSGRTYYGSTGGILAMKLYKRARFYIRPTFEYRHFDNSRKDMRGAIYHELISYGVSGGIRFHLL